MLKTTLQQAKNAEKIVFNGQPILHYACKLGKMKLIQMIISINKINLESTDSLGSTILHIACKDGNLRLTKYLIDKQHMEKDYKNKITQVTILHCACASGEKKLVNFLVSKKRYDIYAISRDKLNIFHYACQSGNIDLVKYLFDDPTLKTVYSKYPQNASLILHYACSSGNTDLVGYLLNEQQFKIDAVYENQNNILHYACLSGKVEMLKYLLSIQNCPSVSNTNKCGMSLWHYASGSGCLRLFQHLKTIQDRNFQKLIDAKTNFHRTIFHFACESGNSVFVQYILNQYPHLMEKKNLGSVTPMHIAMEKKFTEIEDILKSFPIV